MSSKNKIQFELVGKNFNDLLQKLEDLSKIGDTIKIKIDSDEIMIYSIIGEMVVLAFKNYIIPTSDYLKFNKEISNPIDIVISGSKKFVKSLGFIKKESPIVCVLNYREDDSGVFLGRFFEIKNQKLKLSQSCGEETEIRDIPKESLNHKLNPKNRKWGFEISKEDFDSIKKLSGINSDGKTLQIQVDPDGNVVISESSVWELEVDKIETTSKSIIFNKSFLSNINDNETIQFHVFESFMLNKDKSSNLMISFETQFED